MLKQLLEKWACKHKWGILSSVEVTKRSFMKDEWIVAGYIKLLTCQECGKIKKIIL